MTFEVLAIVSISEVDIVLIKLIDEIKEPYDITKKQSKDETHEQSGD